MKASKKTAVKSVGLLTGGLLLSSLSFGLGTSPFQVNELGSAGFLRSSIIGSFEATCGETNAKNQSKTTEQNCGEKAKATSEQKCGEGKCGEGKCGEKAKATSEQKCGEGKCGEGKCGEKTAPAPKEKSK
jgi:uncharacterized low-complexity protein